VSDQRFERLEALKAEAAETLRPPIDSDKVTLLETGGRYQHATAAADDARTVFRDEAA
jgi:hypothetical protein